MTLSKSVVALIVLFSTSDGFSPSIFTGNHHRVTALRVVSIEENVVPHKLKKELIPDITGEVTTRGKKENTLVDDKVASEDPGLSVPTEPAAPSARVSHQSLVEGATETPKSIIRGKDDFVPTPGQTALHPSQVNKLNLSFIPVMAEEATAFAKKVTKNESERLVATNSMDKKPMIVVETPKRDLIPIPYQTSLYSSQNHEPFLPIMSEEAVAFAKKRAIDSEMFVVTSPHPTRDDFIPEMASEAVAFGKKKAIETGLFKASPQTIQEVFMPHMASEAVRFGKKKAVGPGLFADDKLATPVRSEVDPMVPFTTSTSIRGKDDFTPTPGQTALHPSQKYKFFIPEMAVEALAFLNKKKKGVDTASGTANDQATTAVTGPTTVFHDRPLQKEQNFMARHHQIDEQTNVAAPENAMEATENIFS